MGVKRIGETSGAPDSSAMRLVKMCGSCAEAAKRLGIANRQVVFTWVKQGYIPAVWAAAVQAATQGRITADEVMADVQHRRPPRALRSR